MAISNIPALVIQENYDVFLNPESASVGQAGWVPTIGAGAVVDGDYWAVPVTNGVVTGFNYHSTLAASTDKPDSQAFHVVRISQNNGSNFWYIAGTSVQYMTDNDTAECCGDTARALPSSVNALYGCQVLCTVDEDGDYIGILGAPTLPQGGYKYVANGYFNGSALIELNAVTLSAMLTQLNNNWGAVGTWTLSAPSPADGIGTFIVTQSDGSGEDVLCAQIVAETL